MVAQDLAHQLAIAVPRRPVERCAPVLAARVHRPAGREHATNRRAILILGGVDQAATIRFGERGDQVRPGGEECVHGRVIACSHANANRSSAGLRSMRSASTSSWPNSRATMCTVLLRPSVQM